MPFIRVDHAAPLTKEQKQEIAARITDAMVDVAKAPVHATYVIFNKLDHEDISVGGTLFSNRT